MMGNHPSLCCFVQVSTNRFSVKEVSGALEPGLESGLADETDAGGLCSGVAGEGVVDTAPLAAVPVPAHISGPLPPAAQQPYFECSLNEDPDRAHAGEYFEEISHSLLRPALARILCAIETGSVSKT